MKPYPLFILMFFSLSLTAQQRLPSNCETPPSAQVELVSNGVRAQVNVGGDLWFDGVSGRYLVAEDPDSLFTRPIATVFAGGLWLAGTDPGGGIKGAFQQYGRSSGRFDYGPGPLDTDGNSDSTCVNWDRLFGVTREDVDLWLQYLAGEIIIEVLPENILGWPGRGNPFFADVHGFGLPDNDFELAPFWDENRDGIYNPMEGDYPAFCGDQAVWCVFNDAVLHRESNTPSTAQVEVHLLAYSFNTGPEDDLFRTTLYDYTLINRAQEDIIDLQAGLWLDFDLGCFADDHFGTIPAENVLYAYNDNPSDTNPCPNGDTSFSGEGVIQIVQVVNSSSGESAGLSSAAAYLSNPLGTPPPQMLSPNTVSEYYNYLRGTWRDGSPIVRNGYGLNPDGSDTTRYLYDGGLDVDGEVWKDCTQGFSFGYFTPVAATGPYTLQPGEKAEFSFALTTLMGVDYPDGECPDESPIVASAQAVRAAYEQGCRRSDLTDTETVPERNLPLTVYPNPTNNIITFRTDNSWQIRRVELYDVTGRSLLVKTGATGALDINLTDSGLAPGVYFYRATDEQGRATSGKVLLRD